MALSIKERLKGVIAYPTTPFRKNNSGDLVVDLEGLKKHLNYLQENKVHIIAPAGGTGEFFSLTMAEWMQVVKTAKEAVTESIVMPAVGGPVEAAKEMAGYAERLGCEVIQIMPAHAMFGNRAEGVLAYNKEVAESVSIAVIPYNFEGVITGDMVDEMAKIKNVIAIKDESGDIQWFRNLKQRHPHLIGICGKAETMAPYYFLAGARAFSSGIVNFLPEVSLEVYDAVNAGEYRRAFKVIEEISELNHIRDKPGRHIPVVKEALKIMGFSEDFVRPPLCPLDEEEKGIVTRVLKTFGKV